MPAQKRYKTKYPGVYYINGRAAGSNKSEKIYYIVYRKNGKQIDEKAGRQFQDDMTIKFCQTFFIHLIRNLNKTKVSN